LNGPWLDVAFNFKAGKILCLYSKFSQLNYNEDEKTVVVLTFL